MFPFPFKFAKRGQLRKPRRLLARYVHLTLGARSIAFSAKTHMVEDKKVETVVHPPDIELTPVSNEHKHDAIDLVTRAMISVPLRRALHMTYEEERPFFKTLLTSIWESDGNVSYVAWDKANHTLASIGVCHIIKRNTPDLFHVAMAQHTSQQNRLQSNHVLQLLCQDIDLHQMYNTDRMLKLHYGASNHLYKRMGLSEKIVVKAMEISKERGAGGAFSTLLGNYTYRMYKKLGYDVLRQLKYQDVLVDGEKVFRDSKEVKGQDHMMLVARPL